MNGPARPIGAYAACASVFVDCRWQGLTNNNRKRGNTMGLLSKLFGGGDDASQTGTNVTPSAAGPATGAAGPILPGDPAAVPSLGESPIAGISEAEATGEVAAIFGQVKEAMQIPFVPNMLQMLANSPQALKATVGAIAELQLNSTLPRPVVSMLLYSIAAASECRYCGSMHKLSCRTLGIDDATLAALSGNLGTLTPERVQAIVAFAVKAAKSPKDLSGGDFEKLRDMGISDAEIVEIVALAALGGYLDAVADALRIDVDEMIAQGLAA
jgi:uncharacterized peroxidase-related enzyme